MNPTAFTQCLALFAIMRMQLHHLSDDIIIHQFLKKERKRVSKDFPKGKALLQPENQGRKPRRLCTCTELARPQQGSGEGFPRASPAATVHLEHPRPGPGCLPRKPKLGMGYPATYGEKPNKWTEVTKKYQALRNVYFKHPFPQTTLICPWK